jgi:hypothetical protein
MVQLIGKIKDLAGKFEDALRKERINPTVEYEGLD